MLKCVKSINCTSWSILFWVKVSQNFNMTEKIQSNNSSCDSKHEKNPDFDLSNNASLPDWQDCFHAILSLSTRSTQELLAPSTGKAAGSWLELELTLGSGTHPVCAGGRGPLTAPQTPCRKLEPPAPVSWIFSKAVVEICLDHSWNLTKCVTSHYTWLCKTGAFYAFGRVVKQANRHEAAETSGERRVSWNKHVKDKRSDSGSHLPHKEKAWFSSQPWWRSTVWLSTYCHSDSGYKMCAC